MNAVAQAAARVRGRSPTSLYRALNRRGLVWPPIVVAIALGLGGQIGTSDQLNWVRWISFGLLALSLDFVWGRAGIFSFGQTAMFGLGGYCFGVIAINFFQNTNETWTALLGAIVVGTVFAALLGYFMFYGRLGDVYLAIITLAVTLVLYTVMASTAGPQYHVGTAQLGGFNGMPAIPPLQLDLPGSKGGTPLSNYGLFVFAVAAAAGVYVLLRLLLASRFGRVVSGLRENELRMELLGYDVRRYKLLAFTIGGTVAGLGGGLFAAWGLFMNPVVFTLQQAALVVIWVMVGGRGSLYGAFIGVVVEEWITEHADKVWSEQTPLLLGLILVVVVLLLPGGIVPTLRALVRRGLELLGRSGRFRVVAPAPVEAPAASEELGRLVAATGGEAEAAAATAPAAGPAAEVVLSTSELGKRFGGVAAVDGVSLEFRFPGAYAVIGPNGAGKSTFFNLLIGRFEPTNGRVWLSGREVTRLQTFQRARLGLGIKLQVPSLFYGLTVAENVWLATNAAGADGVAGGRAEAVLRAVGLAGRAEVVAAELSHGEQQWLEIAMVLAARPSTVLLDEPAAGMTREERAKTVELVRSLAREHAVIVVEHDMEFIRALEVPVTMFHQGRVFRSGSFEEIRRDQEVIDVYLGRSGRAEPA